MFDSLFDALPVSVAVWDLPEDLDDLGGQVLRFANRAAERELRLPLRMLVGATRAAIFADGFDETVTEAELLVAALLYRTVRTAEIEGDGRLLRLQATPMADRQVVVVTTDLTEMLTSRQRLGLLSQLLDNAPEFIVIGRYGSGAIDYANLAAVVTLGLEASPGAPEVRFEDRLTDESFDLYLHEALPSASRTGMWEGELDLEPVPGRVLPVSAVVLCSEEDVTAPDRYAILARDITGQRHQEAQLRNQAMHDALTGLPNRAFLEERLAVAVAEFHGGGTDAALLYIDLDRFKPINDHHGHDAGDLVLREVASRLRASLRDDDVAARLGGDEFVVLAIGLPASAAASVAQRIEHSVKEPILLPNGVAVSVGASIGVVPLESGIRGVTEWLAAADFAMYEIKRNHHG